MTTRVSRETEAIPAAARTLFAAALPQATALAALLSGPGAQRGLVGPREDERLWSRHLLNCGVVAAHLPPRSTVADVGSGAGLPGVVWALLRPDVKLTLIEPSLRRSAFLHEVVQALSLPNVEVVRARAEGLHGTRSFDVVTARGVAPLPRLLPWCLPLLAPGGELIALKGASAAAELAAVRPSLSEMGATIAVIKTYGEGMVRTPTTAVHVRVAGERTGRRSP